MRITKNHWSISGPTYGWLVAVLVGFKYFLSAGYMRFFITEAIHDDVLFLKLAESISRGAWLGGYDNLTLVKGPIYPFFIAFAHFWGIPLFFAEFLLLVFGSALMAHALKPVLQNRSIQLMIFGVLLFNPMTANLHVTRILRDSFYTTETLIFFASLIGLFVRAGKPGTRHGYWSMLAGISLFCLWNTREEGALLLPPALLLLAGGFYRHWLAHTRQKTTGNVEFLRIPLSLGWFVLPMLTLLALNGTLATINYVYYGGFVRNEFKSEAFTSCYQALLQIEGEDENPLVPLTTSTIRKAYRASPTFNQVSGILDNPDNPWNQFGEGPDHEIKGGFLVWALRDATQATGAHQSLVTSQDWYRQVATEINQAFKSGQLKKYRGLTLQLFKFNTEILMQLPARMWVNLKKVSTFQECQSALQIPASGTNLEVLQRFQFMTNDPANFQNPGHLYETKLKKLKTAILTALHRVYAFINPVLFLAGIIGLGLSSLQVLKGSTTKLDRTFLATGIVFLYLLFTRVALISLSELTWWGTNNKEGYLIHYFDTGYPFMLLFGLIGTYTTLRFIKRTIVNHEAGL